MTSPSDTTLGSWRDRLLVLVATFTLFVNIDVIVGALPVHIGSLGGGEREIGILTGIFAGGTIAARPLLAFAAARKGLGVILFLAALNALIVPGLYLVAPSIWGIGTVRSLQAIIPAGVLMTVPLILSDLTPPKERGRVLGLYGVANGLSLLIAPALGVSLIRSGGMPSVAGLSVTSGLIAACALFSARLALAPRKSSGPEKSPSPAVGGSPQAAPPRAPEISRKDPKAAFGLLLLLNLLSTYAFGTVLSFATLHGMQLGIPNPGIFFTAYSVGTMLARYFGGHLADHYGTRWTVPLSLLVLAGGLGAVSLASEIVLFTAGAAWVGAGFGALQTLYWSEFVSRSPSERAAASAWFSNAFDAGIMVGAWIGGWVASWGGYPLTYGLAALLAAAGLPIWTVYRRKTGDVLAAAD